MILDFVIMKIVWDLWGHQDWGKKAQDKIPLREWKFLFFLNIFCVLYTGMHTGSTFSPQDFLFLSGGGCGRTLRMPIIIILFYVFLWIFWGVVSVHRVWVLEKILPLSIHFITQKYFTQINVSVWFCGNLQHAFLKFGLMSPFWPLSHVSKLTFQYEAPIYSHGWYLRKSARSKISIWVIHRNGNGLVKRDYHWCTEDVHSQSVPEEV